MRRAEPLPETGEGKGSEEKEAEEEGTWVQLECSLFLPEKHVP